MSRLVDWLRTHDPGYIALRRAARTALVMPAMFAVGDKVIGNPVIATFAAFGSFAMVLLVDFAGPIRERLLNQAALGVACALLIALATLVSRTTWLSALAMALVAFVVVFAGAVSSVLASATTTLLLAFILPASLPGSVSAIPDRIAGWALATAVSLPAIALLWPAPARNPVRTAATAATRALAKRLRTEVAYVRSGGSGDAAAARSAAATEAEDAVQTMQNLFFATPYRPGGLSTDGRAIVRLVDELRWLNTIVQRSAVLTNAPRRTPTAGEVKLAAADVLEHAADRIEVPEGTADALRDAVDRMSAALAELEHATMRMASASDGRPTAQGMVSALDPSFRAQEISFIADRVAMNADLAAAALQRSWVDRVLGREPRRFVRPLTAARRRASVRLAPSSLALQNALRAAAALGVSVLVADLTSVQHGFWVVLGTLSVLRSNALSTGQNFVRALAGTAVGFFVGGLLVYLVGTNTAVLWALLPVAILFAGLAPAAISFAAGQAGFTLTLLILFNLIAPAGWRVGLVRIEDIALGGVVSLAVGALFWPRGATAGLSRALADAYYASARYLTDAVAYGVGRCDSAPAGASAPHQQARAANAASQRLDDAFRGYLSERGSKPAGLADVTGLVTGVTAVELAAAGVLDLWDGSGEGEGDRSAARAELLGAARTVNDWYDHFASSLVGTEPVPSPLDQDERASGRLLEAVARDLRSHDGDATATGVRVIWTGDHLDAMRRLQASLVVPARAAADGVSHTETVKPAALVGASPG